MKKDEVKVNVNVDEDGDVKVTIAEDAKPKIPRVGDNIHVIQPYNADDDAEDDGIHEKPIKAYSLASVFVKATTLNDEADEVTVNGDYRIPLYKDINEANKKLLVFVKEEKAFDKWTTLMRTSLEEAERREEKAKRIADYVREALKKVNH